MRHSCDRSRCSSLDVSSTVALSRLRSTAAPRSRRPPQPPAGQPPPGGRRRARRRRARRRAGDDADDARAWADGGQIPAKYTQAGDAGLAAARVEQRARRRHQLRADRARPRRGDRQRHRRHPALDAVEHSGGVAQPARGRAAGHAAAGRHAADQRQRSVLSRPRRAGGGPGASLRLRALRARHDARRAGGRRLAAADARRRRGRDGRPRSRQGGLRRTVQASIHSNEDEHRGVTESVQFLSWPLDQARS